MGGRVRKETGRLGGEEEEGEKKWKGRESRKDGGKGKEMRKQERVKRWKERESLRKGTPGGERKGLPSVCKSISTIIFMMTVIQD